MARAEGNIVITVGGNVSPLTDAVTKAERTLGKLNTATQRADKQFRAMVGTSTEMQARIDALSGVTDRLGKSAERSAEAFAAFDRSKAAVDRLRASYDPLFAASKRYEAAVEQLDEALRRGVITQGQYATMTAKLGQNMLTADGAAGMMAGQVGKVGGASTRLTSQIQNASYQVGDFAVQIASGTAASRALAQQLPQLLGGFGMWGAVAGAAVAIGGALVPMFMGAGAEAKSLEERTNDLSSALSKFNASVDASRAPIKELTAQYGRFADEVQRALAAIAAADQRALAAEFAGAIKDISDAYSGLFAGLEVGGETSYFAMRKLEDQLRMNSQEVLEFKSAILELQAAETFAQQAAAALKVMEAIDKAKDSAGRLPPVLQQSRDALVRLVPAAAEANAKINQMEGFLDAAARAADGAASSVDGIGSAASGAYGKVAKLAGAMWDLAHAQRAAEQNRQADSMVYGQVGARGDPRTSNTQGYGEFDRPTIDDYIKEFTEKGRGGGGGGGKKGEDEAQRNLEKLQKDFMTEQELLSVQYEERLLALQEARQRELLTEQEYQALKLQAQQDFNNKMRAMDAAALQTKLSAWSGAFGDLASLMNTGNKKLFKIGKMAALAQAVVDGWSSATSAWEKGMKIGGPPVAAAFTAMSLARTGAMIASIKSAQFEGGGGGTGGGAGSAPAAPATSPQKVANYQISGDVLGKSSAAELFRTINQGIKDGYTIHNVEWVTA